MVWKFSQSVCLHDKNICLTSIQKYFTPDTWGAGVIVVESMNTVEAVQNICDDKEN